MTTNPHKNTASSPVERHFGPVWFLPGGNRGKYPSCHSIYINGPGILIDPASDRQRLAALRDDHGVRAIWLSHAHEDHLVHLDLFPEVPLYVAQADAGPLAGTEALLDAYGVDDQLRPAWRDFLSEVLHYQPRPQAGFLSPGCTMDAGGVSIEIIASPGHTPGHLAFFFPEQQLLFAGDYDLTPFGPWYGDVAASIEATRDSVALLRTYAAPVVLTGHETGVFERPADRTWDAYLAVIETREAKLLAFLAEPRTLQEIVGAAIVYGRPRKPAAFFNYGEQSTMAKHLERLIRYGRVIRQGRRFVRV